jgi:hypothetical protein
MSPREQRLIGLLRRLLRVSDDLRAQNEYLRALVRQLGHEHRAVRDELAKARGDHAAEAAAADVLCGAAMDELLARRD